MPAGARGGLDTEACLTRETLGPLLPGWFKKGCLCPLEPCQSARTGAWVRPPLLPSSPSNSPPEVFGGKDENSQGQAHPRSLSLLVEAGLEAASLEPAAPLAAPSVCPAYLPSPIAAAPSLARRQERPLGFHPSTAHIFSSRPLGALSHRKPCRTSLTAQQKRQS